MMEPVSSVIYETLMRQAIRNGRAGTRAVPREKAPASAVEALNREVTEGAREENAGLLDMPSPERQRRPALRVVSSKYLPIGVDTRIWAGNRSVGKHLTLVQDEDHSTLAKSR